MLYVCITSAVDNSSPSGSLRPGDGVKAPIQRSPHIMNKKPTMNQLMILKPKGGGSEVRITERIGTKFYELGTILLKDDYAKIMETVKENERGNVDKINTDLLRRWLNGNGAPVTWKVLVDALEDIKEKELADDIVKALHT